MKWLWRLAIDSEPRKCHCGLPAYHWTAAKAEPRRRRDTSAATDGIMRHLEPNARVRFSTVPWLRQQPSNQPDRPALTG